jgi:hypothetical protein
LIPLPPRPSSSASNFLPVCEDEDERDSEITVNGTRLSIVPVGLSAVAAPPRLFRLFLNFIANFFHIFADSVSRIPAAHHTEGEYCNHCENESLYFNRHIGFGLSFRFS